MPAGGDSRWKWQEAMQLRMPRGQVVSPRRRGYAGNRAARQAFFSNFLRDSAVPKNQVGGKQRPRARPPEELIVGKIIRLKLRRRSEHLIALDERTAVSARDELILIRIRRNDSGAPRGKPIIY